MTSIAPGATRSLRIALLASLLFAACAPRGLGRPPPARNVVFLLVDTLRADHLGVSGLPRPTTPAIDRIAATGFQFENAYTVAPWTLPSVASAFTGLYPRNHGLRDTGHMLPTEVTTLAEILGEQGFLTAAVVSNPLVVTRYGIEQGFSVFDETEAALGEVQITGDGVTQRAIALIERAHGSGERLLLYVHYFDPHASYLPHPEYGFSAPAGRLRGGEKFHELWGILDTITPQERKFITDTYDEEIRFTDDGIGRILDTLAELGIEDETLVVLVSDHGEAIADRRWIGHTVTLYEELVRVPLILRVPGAPARRAIVRSAVSIVRLPATILELLGVDAGSREFQGRSLTDLLFGPGEPPSDVYLEVDFDPVAPKHEIERTYKKGIIHDGWKLVHDDSTGVRELFDLAADPAERTNLARTRPERAAELAERLDAHLAAAGEGSFATREVPLTERQVERLRALGYAGAGN